MSWWEQLGWLEEQMVKCSSWGCSVRLRAIATSWALFFNTFLVSQSSCPLSPECGSFVLRSEGNLLPRLLVIRYDHSASVTTSTVWKKSTEILKMSQREEILPHNESLGFFFYLLICVCVNPLCFLTRQLYFPMLLSKRIFMMKTVVIYDQTIGIIQVICPEPFYSFLVGASGQKLRKRFYFQLVPP